MRSRHAKGEPSRWAILRHPRSAHEAFAADSAFTAPASVLKFSLTSDAWLPRAGLEDIRHRDARGASGNA